ncbi:MAG: PD40 domain-containing protein [Anaerolineales bacterium]|nr:PD40 domain-containing protein [Anaerolineales bacterium]
MKIPVFFLLLYGVFLFAACQPTSETTQPHEPTSLIPVESATAPLETSAAFTPDPQTISTPTPELWNTDLLFHMHGDSFSPAISSDGRFVVFVSRSGDLIEKGNNHCVGYGGISYNCSDIFLYDLQIGTLRLVSIGLNNQSANGNSYSPTISSDGRWIAFVSEATNLSANRMGTAALFLYDSQNEHLELIAPAAMEPSISADGRIVVYSRDSTPRNIYLYDRYTGINELISQAWNGQGANGDSIASQISADRRFVAFWSWAGNLIPDDTENCRENETYNYSCGDVFIFDRETSQMERIPIGETYGLGMGNYSLSLSANGDLLAFNCQIYDRKKSQVIYEQNCGKLSEDGQLVVFQQGADYFINELETGLISQVSIASDGTPSNGEWVDFEITFEGESFRPGFGMSKDAQWVVFSSTASNFFGEDNQVCDDVFFKPHNCYDIYVHNRETGLTDWISKPLEIQR